MIARPRTPVTGVVVLLGVLAALAATSVRAADWTPPSPEVRTLGNGLRVAVFRDTRLPLVHVALRLPAGIAAEPPGAEGASFFAAELLREGTVTRDAATFRAELDRTGSSFAVTIPSCGYRNSHQNWCPMTVTSRAVAGCGAS